MGRHPDARKSFIARASARRIVRFFAGTNRRSRQDGASHDEVEVSSALKAICRAGACRRAGREWPADKRQAYMTSAASAETQIRRRCEGRIAGEVITSVGAGSARKSA